MKQHEFLIYRLNEFSVENAVVVKASTDDNITNDEELLEAIKDGVTNWVKHHEDGKRTFAYADMDMNIGDLIGEDVAPIIAGTNIHSLEFIQLDVAKEWTYDTVVVNDPDDSWDRE